MNPLVFLYLCIGTRLALVYWAKSGEYRDILMAITAVISVGFLTIYAFDLRKTGAETGGRAIWWNSLRVIHGLLFGAFAISTYMAVDNAWMLLLLDVIIGILAYFYFK